MDLGWNLGARLSISRRRNNFDFLCISFDAKWFSMFTHRSTGSIFHRYSAIGVKWSFSSPFWASLGGQECQERLEIASNQIGFPWGIFRRGNFSFQPWSSFEEHIPVLWQRALVTLRRHLSCLRGHFPSVCLLAAAAATQGAAARAGKGLEHGTAQREPLIGTSTRVGKNWNYY